MKKCQQNVKNVTNHIVARNHNFKTPFNEYIGIMSFPAIIIPWYKNPVSFCHELSISISISVGISPSQYSFGSWSDLSSRLMSSSGFSFQIRQHLFQQLWNQWSFGHNLKFWTTQNCVELPNNWDNLNNKYKKKITHTRILPMRNYCPTIISAETNTISIGLLSVESINGS